MQSMLHHPQPHLGDGAHRYSHESHFMLQADINQQADEYEEILKKSRAKMEAASRELADWELQTARARNEGTFFKGLFKADVLQQSSDGSGGPFEEDLANEVDLLPAQLWIAPDLQEWHAEQCFRAPKSAGMPLWSFQTSKLESLEGLVHGDAARVCVFAAAACCMASQAN